MDLQPRIVTYRDYLRINKLPRIWKYRNLSEGDYLHMYKQQRIGNTEISPYIIRINIKNARSKI